ncbi:MAG TPA: MBL fold metallo-hydrolase [Gammaproteobacteria bacterium]|nr:MBL fold metallo-hydrolase [Gammaproteobacteria bacterium]
MDIQSFYDERTGTLTYVVFDAGSGDALVIDPVLDYDPVGSRIWTESVQKVLDFVADRQLKLHFILETHAHADHLSGAQMIKEQYPDACTAIGARITKVQEIFKAYFDLPEDFPTDGRQFDRLLEDGETVQAGSLSFQVIFTPGHTPACATYRFGDAVFTGDTLFMPDTGTGRCDFPGGSARDLYHSITDRLYTLPDDTRVFVGHDYMKNGRELAFETSIGEQKSRNVQLRADTSEAEFIKFRTENDKTLAAPRLLFQSVQVNIDAGALPEPADNEKRYLKIPISIFRPEPKAEDMALEDVG